MKYILSIQVEAPGLPFPPGDSHMTTREEDEAVEEAADKHYRSLLDWHLSGAAYPIFR